MSITQRILKSWAMPIAIVAFQPVLIVFSYEVDPWLVWLQSMMAGAAANAWWTERKVGKRIAQINAILDKIEDGYEKSKP